MGGDPYIRYQSPGQGPSGGGADAMEVIMYPQGQLVSGASATTIGPNLQQFLSNNRRFSSSPEDTQDNFDSYDKYDSFVLTRKNPLPDESSDISVSDRDEGFLPKLWRSAKDDLKLVGDVIKFGISSALNR